MAVGFPVKVDYETGDVLTAQNMNDLSGTVNLLEGAQYAAGVNKIINGDFGVWQRGTSGFSLGGALTADRWYFYRDGSGATEAVTQQTFTPGTAPVAGYEGQFFWRYSATVAGTGGTERAFYQRIEDVRTLANETVTISFWAKADAARTITGFIRQHFGSGGSANVDTSFTSQLLTTSWARYSATIALPSLSGKTIGTSSFLQIALGFPINVTETIDIWGVQLESGSTASDFQTATGTKQGELAVCQRYYNRYTPGTSAYGMLSSAGVATSTTLVRATFALPVEMRTVPSAVDYSTLRFLDSASGTGTISAANLLSSENSPKVAFVEFTSTGLTANRPTFIQTNNSTSGFVGFTAEL
jgi:hypothetical protein